MALRRGTSVPGEGGRRTGAVRFRTLRTATPAASPERAADVLETGSFGSDQDGLVWGYGFTPGTRPSLVDCPAAARLLAEPPRRDGTDPFLFDFRFDASEVSTVYLCVGPRVMVSARPRPVRSLDRLRGEIKSGTTFGSTADLLAHLLQEQATVLVDIVRRTTARVDEIEDSVLHRQISISRAELSSLRRLLVRLQRLLPPEPAALFRLLSRPPYWIDDRDLQNLRQSAEEFATAVADSSALVERIKLLQEELAAIINEQSNRILFLLTLATVLAVPFGLVTGLFGMNVGGVPLAGHPHGFVIVLSAVATLTTLGGCLVLRRRES